MGLNLDRRIQIRRAVMVDDGFSSVEVWTDLGPPLPASRSDVSDAEKMAGGGVISELSSRFIVRSSTFTRGLNTRDRLTEGGRLWHITGIKERSEQRFAFLEISATARAD